jgi:hypothetical protein
MPFDIFYDPDKPSDDYPPYKTLHLPNNTEVDITGECGNGTRPEMTLSWKNNNSLRMKFGTGDGKWKLQELTLVFNLSAKVFNLTEDRGLQTFCTNGTNLFSRKFKTHEYFYCKNCKTYQFDEASCEADSLVSECQSPCINYTDPSKGSDEEQGGTCPNDKNKTVCSCAHMEKSVIYIDGDPDKADKRLCLEDYIALQEIIVPIAVGGVLTLLLILIFLAYVIAYISRRRREAKSHYEPVGDF